MSRETPPLIEQTAQAARRFHFMARLHLARPHRRGLAREGQAVLDLLWQMGFRPLSPAAKPEAAGIKAAGTKPHDSAAL